MAKFSFARMDQWARQTQDRMDRVVRQSAMEVFSMASRNSEAKARGGSIKPGFVPRDVGTLAASAQFSLSGSTALAGEAAYVMALAGMKAGDVAELGWTAVYARKVHYSGWLWVDTAANRWQEIVAGVVTRAMAGAGR